MDPRATLQAAMARQPDPAQPRACKICDADAPLLASLDFGKGGGGANVGPFPFGRYDIDIPYYSCTQCGFVFTSTFDEFTPEQWSGVIYNDDYAKVDPDYSFVRPVKNAHLIDSYLRAAGQRRICLDYGGGNGETARRLRALGWSYDNIDPFGGRDHVCADRPYDFCTSFEVFEHLPQPLTSLADVLSRCVGDRLLILIGTKLSDGLIRPGDGLQWWYAQPRNGHISLYSRRSMRLLAKKTGLDYFSVSRDLHFLTRQHNVAELVKMVAVAKIRRTLQRYL
jgi:hypothetical protein